MKKQYLLTIIILILAQAYPALADDDDFTLNPFDIGADMVRNGFERFLLGMGDEIYAGAGINGTSDSMNSFVMLSTLNIDPYKLPKINQITFISAIMALIIVMIYIPMGMLWIVICGSFPSLALTISEITDADTNTPFSNYLSNIGIFIVSLLLGYSIVKMVLIANYILAGIILKYAEFSTIDTSSNYILHILAALVFLLNILFYVWRLIVIILVAGFALVIGALLMFSMTRDFAITVIKYFILLVFMQTIVIFIIVGGMVAIDFVNTIMPVDDLGLISHKIVLNISLVTLIASAMVAGYFCLYPFLRIFLKTTVIKRVLR